MPITKPMTNTKTTKNKTHKRIRRYRYKTKRLILNKQSAGGFFSTSNSERILKKLQKHRAILSSQADEILKASKLGKDKKEKINLFVDKCVDVLLFNLFTIWKDNKSNILKSIGNEKKYQVLISQLDEQFKSDKGWQYEKLHKIYLQLHQLGYQIRQDFYKILNDNTPKSSKVVASSILEISYLLNDNWINEGAINTMTEPKFVDLDRMWFNKKYDDWFERNYKWILLLS